MLSVQYNAVQYRGQVNCTVGCARFLESVEVTHTTNLVTESLSICPPRAKLSASPRIAKLRAKLGLTRMVLHYVYSPFLHPDL